MLRTFGTFTVTHDITRYTKARMFSEVGKKTELFLRFSTVAGERGAADAERVLAVFFFRDPLTAQPHEPDVSALVRLCDVHDIPLATNPASAEALMLWLREQIRYPSAN